MYPKLIAKAIFIPLCVVALNACEQQSSESVVQAALPLASEKTDEIVYQAFLSDLVENHVLPAYQQLEKTSIVFVQTVHNSCKTPQTSLQQLSELQAKWRELNISWQTIQWLRLGPIKDNNQHSRLQYWPDANGASARGVGQLFAKQTSPSVAQLSQMNVGAQGLPAAEIMLFSQLYQAADMQSRRCELLKIVATNMTEMAKNTRNKWQVSGDYYQQFVQGQGEFSSTKDTFEELFSNWVTQLTLIKDNKLLYPLGISSPGILALTESPHADVSGLNIHFNLLALQSALQIIDNTPNNIRSSGLDALFLKTASDVSIAQRIKAQLNNAITISAAFPASFSQQLASEAGRDSVKKLIDSINQLQDLLSIDMASALTLNVGFNSLDGD